MDELIGGALAYVGLTRRRGPARRGLDHARRHARPQRFTRSTASSPAGTSRSRRMLTAIAAEDTIERSYAAAVEHGYLWYEFGDSHLNLR